MSCKPGTATSPAGSASAGPADARRTSSAISRRVLRVIIRVAATAVALLLVSVVSVLGYAKVQSGRSVTLPAPTGPDRAGRAVFDWTDHSRADPYAPSGPAGFTPRELSVLVWYPAAPAPNGTATSYQPPGWDQALGEGGISALVRTPPSRVHSHAMADAPVAGGASHPVLVFAPGLGLEAADYTTLAEDLASHGYVVAGMNPTYSTDVVLSGSRVVRSVDDARDGADLPKLVQLWA